jgi:acetylglutamate kinase
MKDLEPQQAFIEDIYLMKRAGINVVVVHGGGPEISMWLKKSGVESRFVNGLRVTDEETMDIVEMVLSGRVNKQLTSGLCRKGINALGISGRDGNLIKARKKYLHDSSGNQIDIGFVGEVADINKKMLFSLIKIGVVPVISPIGCDNYGNRYNINADYAASYISAAIGAEKLIILTDVEGVYRDFEDKTSLIASINVDEIKQYISGGIINGGMIPKLECCMDAIENGTKNVDLIDGRKKHSLVLDLVTSCGTRIVAKEEGEQCQKVI